MAKFRPPKQLIKFEGYVRNFRTLPFLGLISTGSSIDFRRGGAASGIWPRDLVHAKADQQIVIRLRDFGPGSGDPSGSGANARVDKVK